MAVGESDANINQIADSYKENRNIQLLVAQIRSSKHLAQLAEAAYQRDRQALNKALAEITPITIREAVRNVGDVQPSPEPQGEEDAREEI